MTLIQTILPTMRFMKMIANCRILQPVFESKKLEQDLKPIEKPSRQLLISDALFIILYVICMMHLFQRVAEHKNCKFFRSFLIG